MLRPVPEPDITPAFTRLGNDERRRQLVLLGERLFTEHAFDEISMAAIAREAGISKALLYHYFPSKRDFFAATLAQGAEELRRAVEPDPDAPPAEALLASLGAYLAWVEDHRDSYAKLVRSVATVPEAAALVEQVRDLTAQRILDGLSGAAGEAAPPAARIAVRGWLWFLDGAILDWLDAGDVPREQLLGLLVGTLLGALTAAGAGALLPGASS
jgi:AcrR family transcriptional regulator